MNWKVFALLCATLVSLACTGSSGSSDNSLANSADQAAKSADQLDWVRYTDSGEGAFSMDVPVGWVQEVGTSREWMPEEYIPEYATSLLRNAASCGNIWGFTWWCSHDIDPMIGGFLNLEYTLGVLDSKNQVKPIGKTIAKLAETIRHQTPEPRCG
jgi:hypothetical protein